MNEFNFEDFTLGEPIKDDFLIDNNKNNDNVNNELKDEINFPKLLI